MLKVILGDWGIFPIFYFKFFILSFFIIHSQYFNAISNVFKEQGL